MHSVRRSKYNTGLDANRQCAERQIPGVLVYSAPEHLSEKKSAETDKRLMVGY